MNARASSSPTAPSPATDPPNDKGGWKRLTRAKCGSIITRQRNSQGKGHSPPCNTCLHSKGLAAGNLRLTWYCPWSRLCSPAPRPQKCQQPSHAPVGREKNTSSQFWTKTPEKQWSGLLSPPPTKGPHPKPATSPLAK